MNLETFESAESNVGILNPNASESDEMAPVNGLRYESGYLCKLIHCSYHHTQLLTNIPEFIW